MNNKHERVFIIAEAGVNHNGSIESAKELIDVAADAGADAVKFQTFITEKGMSRYAPKAEYQLMETDANETQFEMVKKLELNQEAHEVLSQYCKTRNIEFMSTPFDLDSVDLLVEMDVRRLKVPSGEIINAPLLLKIAQTGKQVILSTGMSTLGEIESALSVLAYGYLYPDIEVRTTPPFSEAYHSAKGQELLREKVTILHCTTEYPTPFHDVNLNAMRTIGQAFGLKVGYSDHTKGIAIPIAAVAQGATVIEKHFTLDRNLPGPDHKASLEPDELKLMVASIREVELAMGHSHKLAAPSEIKNKSIARKSLVAACNINRGEVFTTKNLTFKRPGSGISPFLYWEYLGKPALRDYKEDDLIE